ncbi:nibrin isoform 2-T2 [Rhinophrynus dorsalis]
MENSVPKSVKSGDRVTFGVFNSKYRVEYEPMVLCSSCLDNSKKNSLNQILLQLGGHIVNNWTEKCTHLVMTSIKVTIKTICALICCRPIVKPDYFSNLMKAIQEKQTLPVCASFIPFLDEPSIKAESLEIAGNAKRKSIFKEKIFLFLNAKQYKKLSPAVLFGGGKVRLLTGELEDTSQLGNPGTCVIDIGIADSQLSVSQPSQTWISSILNFLQSNDLRAIPEAEIGLAVIYMSTEIYCNPRRRSASANDTDSSNRKPILGSTLSLSVAVDETILPGPTLNITAYVANTEPQDQPDTMMDISGVREVRETPKSKCRDDKPKAFSEKDRDTVNGGNVKVTLFPEDKMESGKVQKPSPLKSSVGRTEKASQKLHSSNKINNYFQPVAKKRDRDDDEKETSFAKLARVETFLFESSEQTNPIVPTVLRGKSSSVAQKPDSDLDMELGLLSSAPNSNSMEVKSSMDKDSEIRKRKELDNNLVEESDLESDEDISVKMDHDDLRSNTNKVKRRKLDSENDDLEDLKTSKEVATTTPVSQKTVHAIKNELEIKKESESQREQSKIPVDNPGEFNGLPSKLLLTEFKSLVVTQRAHNSRVTASVNHGNSVDFKKFRKVAYPGAGSFPHIIGGSDLIAHDKKKNSELEQWLRQEIEEQTQNAKEELMAEDLFRYNPKSVKRRR